jgi:alpha-aminoadipic semialdehyde synthase
VVVQVSPLRIYPDEEYAASGAALADELSGCRVVLGVKEVPPERVLPQTTYTIFPHVIKGQPESMPALTRFLERRCTLIDYESIVDRFGRRLIFFGRHAGYAGMVDALWALGRRLEVEGMENAFSTVEPAHRYRSVEAAAEHLSATVGRRIRDRGVRQELHPLVVGFTGGGNVAAGAQEIFHRLPVVEVSPEELPDLFVSASLSRRAVYKVVFRRQSRDAFERYLPYLTVLVNGIYWMPGQPRLVTREALRRLFGGEKPPRLRILADISCDVDGSIAATVRTTTPDAPVYAYDPATAQARPGFEGKGPVVLAVDNLPAEFPLDASEHFGDSLFPFLSGLVTADYRVAFEHLTLPAALLGAVVTHEGELTPAFRYLGRDLERAGG